MAASSRVGGIKRLSLSRMRLVGKDLSGRNLRGADFSGADLRNVDFSNADLRNANFRSATTTKAVLRGAILAYADFSGANFYGADFTSTRLTGAYLQDAVLRGADFTGASLTGSWLTRADFRNACLKDACLLNVEADRANLSYTNLSGAVFRGACLAEVNLKGATLPAFQIPQYCTLVGWKKLENNLLAKLIIPPKAKRTAALVGLMCRAEYAYVAGITDSSGRSTQEGVSMFDDDLRFTVGQEVHPDAYNDDIRVQYADGIQFFMHQALAVNYTG